MNQQINIAIQVLPTSSYKSPYDIVDAAIETIAMSGLPCKVCPFETVVQGPYGEVMELVRKVQETCYQAGAESVITNLKIQTSATNAVTIEDKIGKYE